MISFPVILINSLSVLMICLVIAAAWSRRADTGARELLILSLLMLVWAVCSFSEMLASGLEQKILWRNLTQIGAFGTPAAVLSFCIAYTGILEKQRKPVMTAAYSIQVAAVLFITTDGWHHLARTGVSIVKGEFYETLVVNTSALSRVLISLNFVYLAVSFLILIAALLDLSTKNMRRQLLCVLTGLLICGGYSLVKISWNERIGMILPISGIFAVADLLMLFGIFRYDMLMLAPIARNEAFNIMGDGLVIAAGNGTIADVNLAAREMLRAPVHDRKNGGFAVLESQIAEHFPRWHEALKNSRPGRFQLSVATDGRQRYFQCELYYVYNRKKPIGSISVLRDITEQTENNALLKFRAEKDGLTGVDNRKTFIERVERLMEEASETVCLLFMDLDLFKTINDNYGHAFGDAVLIAVCRLIQEKLSEDAFLGRMGGEEFAVFWQGTGPEAAAALAERLRAGVAENRFLHDGAPVSVTISIGVAAGRFESFDALYQTADGKLYQAKQAGRNCVKR